MTGKADNAPDSGVVAVREEYCRAVLEAVAIRNDTRRCDPLVISVVRDELALVDEFLGHYRKAGIRRFAIIDNNSSDRTADYLLCQPDVDLYRAPSPFTTVRKQAWLNLLIDLYNQPGQWFLHADADEHIVFDGLETGRTFADLATIMETQDIFRVRGCLVDMYAPDADSAAGESEGASFDQSHFFFDADGYREYRLPPLIAREGGPRQRLFGEISEHFRPQLTKYPLFRFQPGDVFVNPHFLWPYDANFRSGCLLGILHYKFLPGFARKVEKAVREGNYWENSFEYRCYQSVMTQSGDLVLTDAVTRSYFGPKSLLESRLIEPVPWQT